MEEEKPDSPPTPAKSLAESDGKSSPKSPTIRALRMRFHRMLSAGNLKSGGSSGVDSTKGYRSFDEDALAFYKSRTRLGMPMKKTARRRPLYKRVHEKCLNWAALDAPRPSSFNEKDLR
ncbi:unnamed protein product [Acanthoscelides obtectus]|uniref:Uncharacterized protein n=1 Tax=Acanthoscelides obtectus TaxID=200917 RepID=A0A9P0KD31_ACAOB|nr:unnamed protein product [Acanthoscelides obtectus]CAK1676529.1 hypothetical protein AOBTE_LOCUS30802 [Acanthoscelides obtectus]